jgi:GTP-binding protein
LRIDAAFVTSAASARDFPRDGHPEIALVGRSNVGKSSVINALLRQRLARTSAAPGKTRLANIYRVVRGAGRPFYLVDLPGYGFAKGVTSEFERVAHLAFERHPAAVLFVDARHPGLESDRAAWQWVQREAPVASIAATKIDKLARGERIRALRELTSVFEDPVLPVSAVTGEGLDELWKLIDRLANSPRPQRRNLSSPSPPKATAPPPRKRSSGSTSRRSKT